MTSREIVRNTIRFKGAPRLPRSFPSQYGYDSDFFGCGMNPSPDARRKTGTDEWGSVWASAGTTNLGEVKEFPIRDWADFDEDSVPDIHAGNRFAGMESARERAGDKYLLASGISIYERVHFLRGLENTWADIYEEPENLCRLLDILVGMNLAAIERYGRYDVDGYMFCDDWGLQNTLMIHPEKWRELWKPRYAKIFAAAHANGMDTFLHSCGYIADILDDLIEVGLDVIHMDQQRNMGLALLGRRFRGRLAFYAPADIQAVLPTGDLDFIRSYCGEMKRQLGTRAGGFIPCWYADPVGAGHSEAAVRAMCDAFLEE
jgi:hypothetical protein